MIAEYQDWFLSLGSEYGVNSVIFGTLFVGKIPMIAFAVGWFVKRSRAGRSTVPPTLLAGFFLISPFIYVAIVGRNIPVWVWIFIAVLVLYGLWSTIRDARRKAAASEVA